MAVDCEALLIDGGCFNCLSNETLNLVYGGMLVILADFHGTNSDLQTALDDAAAWSGKNEQMYWAAMDVLWLKISQVTIPGITVDPCERLFENPCLSGRNWHTLWVMMVQTFCNELVAAGVVANCDVAQFLAEGSKFNSLGHRDRALAYLSILCGITAQVTGVSPCATDAELFTDNPWNCRCCGPVFPKVFGAITIVLSAGTVETFFRITEESDFRHTEEADSRVVQDAP